MQYRFEFTTYRFNLPLAQYEAPKKNDWDESFADDKKREIVWQLIKHIVGNPAYMGYMDIVNVYSYYEDNVLYKYQHEEVDRRFFIDCWVTDYHCFRYFL